jgi:PAS domain S-box-containing protein
MTYRPTIILSPDGRYSEANAAALELLGVTRDELRASDPGRFAAEPTNAEADAAFREAWEASGKPDIGGATTIRRADGTEARVKFAIRQMEDGSYTVLLTPVPDARPEPTTVYTAGDVLAAWRASERQLETLPEDAPERLGIMADIEEFRQRYQLLFQRGLGSSG